MTTSALTIKARFDGKVFIPDEPVNLPAGSEIEISIAAPNGASTLAGLVEIGKAYPDNPDSPTDLAAQHDHYLYGTPKQP